MAEIAELSESSAVSKYPHLKNELLRCIDEMLTIEAIRGCPCEELREKIEKNTFNLVVVGQFKRGKILILSVQQPPEDRIPDKI